MVNGESWCIPERMGNKAKFPLNLTRFIVHHPPASHNFQLPGDEESPTRHRARGEPSRRHQLVQSSLHRQKQGKAYKAYSGFSWAQVNPHNDLGRVGGPAAVGGRVGKTKVSVKGLGSSSSCCKQTKLTFASANC